MKYLCIYDASTGEKVTTYQDCEASKEQINPTVLDSQTPVFLAVDRYYKRVLTDRKGRVLSVDHFNTISEGVVFNGLGI